MAAEDHASLAPAEALLHRVLDGQASPGERAAFARELAASASLRESYRALSGLVQALEALPVPDPPAGMKAAVLAQLGARRPPRRLRPRMLIVGFAWASAATLLLVFAVRQTGPAPSHAAGSLAPVEAAGWPLLSRTATAKGVLTIRQKGQDYAFFLEGPGSPSLRWDPAHWEAVATTGNPILLRRLAASTEVGLRIDGVEVLTLPIPGPP